jgi:hypothetical protein
MPNLKKMNERVSNRPRRSLQDYYKMGRTLAGNHLRTQRSQYKEKPKPNPFRKYLSTVIWGWIYYYIKSRFGCKAGYTSYTETSNGIFQIGPGPGQDQIVLGIAGDWATDTSEAVQIADRIKSFDPDITIHIGDTYFVGAPSEIRSNFLGENPLWHRGKNGSLALLGNHEMYAQGKSYFRDLLPALNIRDRFGTSWKQQAAYFCLETDHWRILGLDTGYNSIGIPGLELTGWFPPGCRFPKKMMTWLNKIDFKDDKGVLVFTHHQYITAFDENEFIKPAKQLSDALGTEREVIWIWGHEHKFAAYHKVKVKDGVTAFGRCIGHGGTPVEIKSPKFQKKKSNYGYDRLMLVDDRLRTTLDGVELGYNGFAMIGIQGEKLTVSYHDHQQELLNETWQKLPWGKLKGTVNRVLEKLNLHTE